MHLSGFYHHAVADGLSIDVERGHMYWTDAGLDTIEKSNLDGSARSVVVNLTHAQPRGIVVHSTEGYVQTVSR